MKASVAARFNSKRLQQVVLAAFANVVDLAFQFGVGNASDDRFLADNPEACR